MTDRASILARARIVRSTVVLAVFLACAAPARAAKNIILMVADGSGHNQWLAASMYEGKVGKQIYDQTGWFRASCCTYSLTLSNKPVGDLQQNPELVYGVTQAWDTTAKSDKPRDFAGYDFLVSTPTDSAAAATALAAGQKTYNNAINWTNDNRPMHGQTIAEISKAAGKSVGVITSVPWSHATPAGLGGAHNVSRNNYAQIAKEMLEAPWLDVIMGAGHPEFDDNGRAKEPKQEKNRDDFQYVGGKEIWQALKAGKHHWKLIETKADFEALTSGATPPKVLGTAQVASTLQEKRQRPMKVGEASATHEPYSVPQNENVPTLATMARAAINCLDDNPNGFYLMIEGGAVDWANHANERDRVLEEQIDYVQAVEAVVAWVESHGGWDDTLLILTADHETGLLWGPSSETIAFQPLEDRGPKQSPGMAYNSNGHSNSLVPLFARGPGSERFSKLTKGNDVAAANAWQYSGDYVDNTDVFVVMRAEATGQ